MITNKVSCSIEEGTMSITARLNIDKGCLTKHVCLYLFLLISFLPVVAMAQSPDQRVVLVSIDGMPDYILDQLIAEGRVPNIARLAENGVRADRMITSFPAVTAVAHPLIWTGANPWENGVTGGQCIVLPYNENNILSLSQGMSANRMQAEPIWSTVARQSKKAFVLQATQTYPQDDIYYGENARFKSAAENLTILDGYGKKLQGYKLFHRDDVEFKKADDWINLPESESQPLYFSEIAGDGKQHFLFFASPTTTSPGYDSLWICSEKDGKSKLAEVSPARPDLENDNYSQGVLVKYSGNKACVYFRLFNLTPDLSSFFLMRTAGHDILAAKKEIADEVFYQAGGFIGNGARHLYDAGLLGLPVTKGGDGQAETIYLETIKKMMSLSEKAVAWSLKNYDWDLFQAYIPIPDEIHHNWLAALNPLGNLEDKDQCEALRQPLLRSYQMVDDYIGVIMKNMPDDALLVLVSDHGHVPVTKTFLPNVVLKKAGLLVFDEGGNIDLSRTKAMYYLGNSYFVVINSKRFKDGIVEAEQMAEVRAQVMQALDSARDEDGEKIVSGYFRPDDEAGIPRHLGGDIYLKLKAGVNCHSHFQGQDYLRKLPYPVSDHYGDPEFRYMNSIFVIGRKYGKVDKAYGVVRGIDIAPTICLILGIDSPLQASGRALEDLKEMIEGNR